MRVAFGSYQLDTEARTLEQRGRRVPLQAKAFDLLAYLIERRERVVSSDELLDALWPDLHVTPAALSTAVQKARHAVADDGAHQRVLHTEHGRGFRFVADVAELPAPEASPAAPSVAWARWIAAALATALLVATASFWLTQRPAKEEAPGHALAVLPFENLSPDPDQQYFADGISEELLSTLARLEGLRVVGRTSSFAFRDSDADLKEIGEALGVDVILEGSVRTAGDRVRIIAQLVDAEDGFQLWAETYDRELGDILEIQVEIATDIMTALRVRLSPKERERLATAPTQNVTAYQAYLLGKQRMASRNSVAFEESLEFFQQAIELDPAFALAHVGLAEVYLLQADYGVEPLQEALAKVRAAAGQALDLDDRLGEAYTTLAKAKTFAPSSSARDWVHEAEAAFQRALELNPNYATTYHWYGMLLRDELGRPEEALALHRRGVDLDPLSAVIIGNVADDLSALGRFDEAVAQYERSLEIDPGHALSYFLIGMDYWWQVSGQLDEAALWLGKSISFDPGQPWFRATLGLVFLDLGDVGKAEGAIQRSVELGAGTYWAHSAMQLLHLYRGDEAASLRDGRMAFELPCLERFLCPLVLAVLRDQALRAGRYAEALASYEAFRSDLLNSHEPRIDNRNYRAAIDLALVLSQIGEQERADRLLDRSFRHIQTRPRLGWHGYGIADVKIHALRGEKQQALSALRQAIDEGWRSLWWYHLQHDPNLESLHGEPEYQAMLEEIRVDMAAQLARVRDMERRGEPAFPAGLPTPRAQAAGSSPTDPQ